jgi:hypothetical protein
VSATVPCNPTKRAQDAYTEGLLKNANQPGGTKSVANSPTNVTTSERVLRFKILARGGFVVATLSI